MVRERDFSGDFFKILEQIKTKYVLSGIDDVVYFDSVDVGLIDAVFNPLVKEVLSSGMIQSILGYPVGQLSSANKREKRSDEC